MDHYNLSDELRQQLLENAAWGTAGVTPRLDETKEEGTKKAADLAKAGMEAAQKAGKPVEKKKATKSKPGAPKPAWEGTESENAEGAEDLEEVAHVCPLCTSQLEEAIEEERILEHLNVVVGLVDRLSQLQEGEEDIDTVIDETISQLLFQDLDEE